LPALRDDRFLWSGFFTPMHTQTHAYMHPPRPRRRRCCSLLFSWSMYGRRLPQEHICVDACGGCNVRHRWCRTETAPPPPLHKSLNRQGTLRTRAPCHVRDGQGRTSRVGAVPGIGSGARILKLDLVHGGWPEMQRQLTQMFTHSPHMRPSAAQRLPRAWSMACKHAWWTCMACRHTAALLDMRYCTCIVAHANSHCSIALALLHMQTPIALPPLRLAS